MDGSDERRSGRSNVVLMATIESAGKRTRVRVSNVSAHGALVAGNTLPMPDAEVIFHCNGLRLQSWVAWAHGGYAGIQYCERTEPERLLRSRDQHQPMVFRDTRTTDCRRPGFRGNQLSDEERNIVGQWAHSQRAGGR